VGVENSQHARLQAAAQARFANADCTGKKESQFVERRLPADGIVAALNKKPGMVPRAARGLRLQHLTVNAEDRALM
jgi:hypothetical protein